ncbi:MAG TPA: LamG-like jellyroll fold domain-containing protein [Bacteroidales bacterium]
MKKVMFKSLLMAAVFSGLIFTSCKKSDSGGNTTNPNDPSNVATKNLVAYFPFDGNGNEKLTGLVPTTTTSKVKFVTGQKGQAYQGDSLAYMLYNLPSTSALTNLRGFTYSCWVKAPQVPTAVAPVPVFFQINGGSDVNWGNFNLTQDRSNADSLNLKLVMYDDNAPSWKTQFIGFSSPSLPASTWMYLTLSYDSASSKFNVYVKGQKIVFKDTMVTNRYGDAPTSGGLPLGSLAFKNATQATIGTWWDLATGGTTVQQQNPWMGYFKGEMDELRIYNRALTDAEVLTLYQDEVATLNP